MVSKLPKAPPGSVWLLPALALGGLTHKGVHTAVNPLFLLIQGHHVLGDLAQEKAEVKESSLVLELFPNVLCEQNVQYLCH